MSQQADGRIVAEVTRNIGCCSMAAVTGGREHSAGCVNHVATDKPAPAAVKVPYEAREAGLAALNNDKTWHKPDSAGVWRANYHRAVELVLEAAAPLMGQPATGVTDEAVERVTAKLYPDLFSDDSLIPEVLRNSGRWQRRHEVRAALEAAQPFLGVRPVVDREAVAERLHDEDMAHSWRQLGMCSDWCHDLYLKRADAVMDLLTGGGSETTD
jgi:hypothetical protein